MEYFYITNSVDMAKVCESTGINRVFIDLERLNKDIRQKNFDSVKSNHSIEDISMISQVLNKSKLMVRVNPINKNSEVEINNVLSNKVDYIMLPMFRYSYEVEKFIGYVKNRAKVVLLFETKDACNNMENILSLSGIDEIHIGLNDLYIDMKQDFIFENLAFNYIDRIIEKVKKYDIPYGFGGIARLGNGIIPAELIMAEHIRLGSSRVILSRSFYNYDNISTIDKILFKKEFMRLKNYRDKILNNNSDFFINQHKKLFLKVTKYLEEINE